MEYTYRECYKANCDTLMENLFSIRDRMGDRWTGNMTAYLIDKSNRLGGGFRWREKFPLHVNYVHKKRVAFAEV